jgi:hypothetical protein
MAARTMRQWHLLGWIRVVLPILLVAQGSRVLLLGVMRAFSRSRSRGYRGSGIAHLLIGAARLILVAGCLVESASVTATTAAARTTVSRASPGVELGWWSAAMASATPAPAEEASRPKRKAVTKRELVGSMVNAIACVVGVYEVPETVRKSTPRTHRRRVTEVVGMAMSSWCWVHVA